MIRVGVVSDTHGNLRYVARARDQLGRLDWLLHAGDYLADAARMAAVLGLPTDRVKAVVGNCDYPTVEPAQELLEFGGVRVLMTHGHHYGVKSGVQRLRARAADLGARVAIFGHSHVALSVEEGGVLLFNPGSLSLPRQAADPPSCGVLEFADGNVTATHLWIR